ncbi:MAG TPA: DMT family transporter [Cyclobacteriaceae bacterium]|nr:DMT family transporter [Cyclobacteriaceae bacterium]
MTGFLFLAIRIIASPLVNLFQKKLMSQGVDPVRIVLAAYLFFSALSIPYLMVSGSFKYPREFWFYMILLGIFDAAGNMFLVKSLRSMDLSIFGPLNAYKPVMALILSFFIIGETPSILGLAGVIVIITGSYFLNYTESRENNSPLDFIRSEGIGFRFLSILLTSIAAVFSKKTIMMSSPLETLAWWSVIGTPVIFVLYLITVKPRVKETKIHHGGTWGNYAYLMTAFLALQIFSLYTFKYVLVGYSLALFQISAIITVFLGSKVFGEGNIKMRYIAAFIMTLGACIIIIFG